MNEEEKAVDSNESNDKVDLADVKIVNAEVKQEDESPLLSTLSEIQMLVDEVGVFDANGQMRFDDLIAKAKHLAKESVALSVDANVPVASTVAPEAQQTSSGIQIIT